MHRKNTKYLLLYVDSNINWNNPKKKKFCESMRKKKVEIINFNGVDSIFQLVIWIKKTKFVDIFANILKRSIKNFNIFGWLKKREKKKKILIKK